MATQAVANRPSYLPAANTSLGEGFEGLGQSDLILPRLTILQPTSKKEGTTGQFHNNLTNECAPVIEAVILKASPARTLWSGDLADKTPECQSYDGVSGRVYGACAQCDFNAEVHPELWEMDGEIKRCNRGYLFLCVNRADESMFLLGAMGTSVKPAKILISQIVQRRVPAFGAVIRWETQQIVDNKGKYFVLKPVVAEWLPQPEVAKYRELFLGIQGVAIHDIDEGGADEPVDTSELPF